MSTAPERTVRCQACGAQMIFLRSELNPRARVPTDAAGVGPMDLFFDASRHVSHFKTCTDPGRFSRTRK